MSGVLVDQVKAGGAFGNEVGRAGLSERPQHGDAGRERLLSRRQLLRRPGDIDVVWTRGYGFPEFLGGPVWWADEVGLARIVDRIDAYARGSGGRHGYWTVCDTLRRCAVEGTRLSDLKRPGVPS